MIHKFLGAVAVAMMTHVASMAVVYHIDDTANEIVSQSIQLPEHGTLLKYAESNVFNTVHVTPREVQCMTENMYYEARNQSNDAMAAVGFIVLNRVQSKRYENTICDVVYEGRKHADGRYVRNKCQFSWVCDGKQKIINTGNILELQAWERAQDVAVAVLSGTIENPIGNATMYHATYVKPYWRKAYQQVATVDDHVFYQKRG